MADSGKQREGSSNKEKAQKSRFLDLPPEVRNLISKLVLHVPAGIPAFCPPGERGKLADTALFLVCRQIYKEAEAVFFECNYASFTKADLLAMLVGPFGGWYRLTICAPLKSINFCSTVVEFSTIKLESEAWYLRLQSRGELGVGWKLHPITEGVLKMISEDRQRTSVLTLMFEVPFEFCMDVTSVDPVPRERVFKRREVIRSLVFDRLRPDVAERCEVQFYCSHGDALCARYSGQLVSEKDMP